MADNGADFRRARLAATGDIAEHIGYRLQIDFAVLTKLRFADAWFDFKDVAGVDRIVIGQFKQPIGLEDLTSFRFNPFLERSPLFLFVPFRQIGAGVFESAARRRLDLRDFRLRARTGQHRRANSATPAGSAWPPA